MAEEGELTLEISLEQGSFLTSDTDQSDRFFKKDVHLLEGFLAKFKNAFGRRLAHFHGAKSFVHDRIESFMDGLKSGLVT